MAVEWHSNLGAFIGASERGLTQGLTKAADEYKQAVQGALSGAYPGGTEAAATTERSDPKPVAGGWEISVGNTMGAAGIGSYRGEPQPRPGFLTWPGGREFPSPLAWELGHHNPFLGRASGVGGEWVPGVLGGNRGALFVRVEVWVPTMIAMRDRLVGIVAKEAESVANSNVPSMGRVL